MYITNSVDAWTRAHMELALQEAIKEIAKLNDQLESLSLELQGAEQRLREYTKAIQDAKSEQQP